MKIKVKIKKETFEEVELDTPLFFKNKYSATEAAYVAIIDDETVVTANFNGVSTCSFPEIYAKDLQKDNCELITKEEFLEGFDKNVMETRAKIV